MVSVTTRGPRINEKHRIDYYFVNKNEFAKLMENNKLIEYTEFNHQYYGIPYREVKSGCINIGVFNPQGLETLKRLKYDYYIIPIYIDEKLRVRMRRSREREGRCKFEFIRRAIVDHFDFNRITSLLVRFNGRYIILKDMDNLWRQANTIERTLCQ